MKRLRILYFAPVFPPEQSGGATHVYELAREWVRAGHGVTVTKGFPSHPHGRVPEEYRRRLLAREEMDGIEIVYTWSFAAANVGFFRRTLGYVSSALFPLLANLALRRRYDVIIGTCPHIFLAVAAFVMGALAGTPYVFEVRDPWPKQIEDLGLVRSRAVIRALEALEMFLCRRARLVVTVTRGVREMLVSRGVEARKAICIPNGVDCELFRPPAEDKTLSIHCRAPEALEYTGDAGMLQRLISNLLDNAIKYTPPGGQVTITLEKREDGGPVLTVADTGPGIAKTEITHIFERFYRGDESRSTEGAGLGLSLARAIARAHGGDITVNSPPWANP